MTMPPQPPGWYHAQGDPPGTTRWWDGAQWVGGPVAVAAPPAPGYGYVPPSPGHGYGFGRPPLSGFWRRVGAWLLDALIIGIPGSIVQRITEAAVPKHTVVCTTFNDRTALCEQPTTGGYLVIALVSLVLLAGNIAYYAYFVGKKGATPGRQACGLRVVDQHTLQPIGVGRAIGRYFASILSAIPCGLGFFWVIWDDKKQTWHDKMVGSVVLHTGN